MSSQFDEEHALSIQRLSSLFSLAEYHILSCLNKPVDEAFTESLVNWKIRSLILFIKRITDDDNQIHYNRISQSLSLGLASTYSFIDNRSLPLQTIKRIMQQPIMIPVSAVVDWEELLNRFLDMEDSLHSYFHLEAVLPKHIVQRLFAIEFYNISRSFAEAKVPFSQALLQEGYERLSTNLGELANIVDECYWLSYDRPPYKKSILKLNALIDTGEFMLQRFQCAKYVPNKFRLPDEFFIEKTIYSNFLVDFVTSHKQKKKQLHSIIKLDDCCPKDNKEPHLTIEIEARAGIIKALKPHMATDSDSLSKLLAGETIKEAIVIKDRPANAVGHLIRQAHKAKSISNTKTEIGDWIMHWFRFQKDNKIIAISESTAHRIMKNSTVPSKSSRIPYQP